MKNIPFEIKQFIISAVRLFYSYLNGGYECIVCGKKNFFKMVCPECRKNYFSVENIFAGERCIYCGKKLISSKVSCLKCREQRILIHTDRVVPLFSYRLWNKELLFRWKINGERSNSGLFAEIVQEVLEQLEDEVIVPVPPRKGKIKANGWDQIDELCEFLYKRFGFRLLKILVRNSVNQQKKLNRVERLETIKNAYSLCKESVLEKALKPFGGKIPQKVCLIDDVCTTGATLECCAALLKSAGVKTVDVVTLFIVD